MKYLFVLFAMVIEVLFHVEIYGVIDSYMGNAFLSVLTCSAFVLLCSDTKYKKWNVGFRCVTLLVFVSYMVIQMVYHQVFGNFLSLKSIVNGAGQVLDFGSTIGEAVFAHIVAIGFAIGLWLLYVITEVVHWKKEERCTERVTHKTIGNGRKFRQGKQRMVYLLVMVFVPVFCTIFFMTQGTGMGSTYDVKIHFHRMEQSMYRLGLLETLKKDGIENLCDMTGVREKQITKGYVWIEETFFAEGEDRFTDSGEATENNVDNRAEDNVGEKAAGEKGEADNPVSADGTNAIGEKAEEVQYHTWDIDFEALIANAENEDVKDVHTYFSKVKPTEENVYTGLFEGYNLIYISAESFSEAAIDKERTPTLYKMKQEGFQFENFYTPSWYLSTIDGEYVNCLSQIPVEGDWSLQHAAENTLSVALGNQLKEKGYLCNAYHNHDAYYYDRTITHPKLGYAFKAVGSGLTFESMYPESDLELMEITVDEYVRKQPFHTYYMTMSGHLPYTYDYNSMAVKNRDVVKGDWSENAACYLAANTELEYAVEYLVKELEQSGQLENTLFVIAPDHYPYGLKKGAYDELLGKEVENDDFEIYRNICLIWSAGMKEIDTVTFPVKEDSYCSNLDLLPTISNLLGLSYDSRLFAGRDMLSEDAGLVMFKDQSFVTEKVRYNATTGETVWAAGVPEDTDYLQSKMLEVQNRFYYSAKVLEFDYYKVIQSK